MAAEPRSTEASREELQSLRDHFKDLEFHEYPLLNEDCKRHFIGCLDSQSLVRIGRCSKNERRLAAGIPLKISGITIEHVEGYRGTDVEVRVIFAGGSRFFLFFKQCHDDVEVSGLKERLLWTIENSEYSKAAVAFLEEMLKKCNYGVKEISLNMGPEASQWAARDGSPIEILPDLRIADIGEMDPTQLKYWLKRMPDNLKMLHLRDVTSEIVELSQFRSARELRINRCDVTDAQLLELKAISVSIGHAPLLTLHGVNVFLKRWQAGEGVDGFYGLLIRKIARIVDHRIRVEDVIEGLDAEEVKEGNLTTYSIRNKVRPNEELRFSNSPKIYHIYADVVEPCYKTRLLIWA